MSVQSDIANIKAVVEGVDDNRVATLAYTETAFNSDDVDGVETFNVSAEQNIPLATKTDFNATVLGKGLRSQASSIPRNAMNHFLGRVSYNLNKLVQKFLSFLTIDAAARAHNANEYDANALYLPGDICYVVADDGTIYTRTYYRRIGVGSTTGIAVTDTSYWKESVAKYGGEHRRYTVADLTGGSYNTSTFYPVVTALQDMQAQIGVAKDPVLRVEVEAFCNGAVAGWANAQRAELRVRSKLTGFAATSTDIVEDNSCIDQTNGTDNSASTPIRFTKLPLGRQVVLWLKGGAKYALWNSFGSAFTLYTTTYNNGLDAAIAPTTGISSVFTQAPVVVKASDAELLDGIDSTRIVYGTNSRASRIITDVNAVLKSGFYTSSDTTNNPTAAHYHIVHTQKYDTDDYAVQIASDVGTTRVALTYIRAKAAGSWGAWQKLWNASNDGDGSGLDADTVDGIDSTRIVYGSGAGASTSASGSWSSIVTKSGFYTLGSSVTDMPSAGVVWSCIVNYFDVNTAAAIVFGYSGAMYVRRLSSGTWTTWQKLWNAENDGSGSGLDAGLLQGLAISINGGAGSTNLQVAATCYGVTDCNNVLGNGIFFQTTQAATNTPVTNKYCAGLQFYIAANSSYKCQIVTTIEDGQWYVRTQNNGTWRAWYKLWNSGNVGTNWPAALTAALGSGWTTALTLPTNGFTPDGRAQQLGPVFGQAGQVGSGLTITGAGYPALAALNATDVAFFDRDLTSLRVYRWSGSSWSQVGSGLTITGAGYPALAALNATDVAFFDSTLESLRVYRWSGSSWSQVGSGLTISGAGYSALDALNATDVAFFDSDLTSLRVYRWSGSSWGQVGSGLTITGAGYPALAALNATDVAFFDSNLESLRVYRWSGSSWSQVGSGLTITGAGFPALATLNATDVAFFGNTLKSLRVYRWSGSSWGQVGSGLTITGADISALAALNATDVAFFDDDLESLRVYAHN